TSNICIEEEYRNPSQHTCERCEKRFTIKKGFEFNPNCGRDDYGSQKYNPHRECDGGTFNNGSSLKCQKCNSCPPPKLTASPCSAESDVVCCTEVEHVLDGRCIDRPVKTTAKTVVITTERIDSSSVWTTDSITSSSTSTSPASGPSTNDMNLTAVFVSVGILSILTLLCVLFILKRRTKRPKQERGCNGEMKEILDSKRIYSTAVFSIIDDNGNPKLPLSVTDTSFKLLAPEVQAAPLNTVLNNLDVLEELILLLDPDQISGAKNTRHLAAQCSFSFAWINYAYSKKDYKSPLVAVLEGVVAKNPDWTVGHLAGLLSGIGRNDAVEILAKLHASEKE
ncbi:putative IGF-like family receptor 1, partial [Triplophysa rosa]